MGPMGKEQQNKRRDFWAIKIPTVCTWSWRDILKESKEVVYMVRHLIGNGENIRIWLDPWQPRGMLKNWFPMQLTYNADCNMKATASSIIENVQWFTPSSLARYASDISELILSIEIRGGEDEIEWAPAVDGKFNLADTYNFIRKIKTPWKWSSSLV